MISALIRRGDWDTEKKRKDSVKTQGKDGHQQARERGLRKDQHCQHLDHRFLTSGTVRFMLNHPVCGTLS